MRPLVIGLFILALLGTGWAVDAAAQEIPDPVAQAESDSLDVTDSENQDHRSWLTRTLARFFGSRSQIGEELDGTAVEMVDNYSRFVGKNIEVVIVHQVERFDPMWDESQDNSTQFLNSVTKPFHSYTRDRTIRDYLLFERGDTVDPFLLADSERMLRSLDFINDARIILVPLAGEPESVVVVVETRDKWPFGITGKIKDPDRYDVNFFLSNIGGHGIRWDNKAVYRGDMEPSLGYQGRIRKNNISGSFVDLGLVYEDTWERLSRVVNVQRTLVHPGIKWVGGAYWEYTDDRDNEGVPKKYELGNYWLGHTFRLNEKDPAGRTVRPVLVPAVRYRKNTYKERPEASAESNPAYLNTKDYLGGLTYQRLKYYKTSFLFRMGETENIPAGFTAKISGGYQDREVYDRTSGFFQTAYVSVRNKGDIFLGSVNLGGYFHDHALEDGALHVSGIYITRLMGEGKWRSRFYTTLFYTLAFNRYTDEYLMLGNRTGIRGLEDNQVLGNQRLILKLESRLFTPWNAMGFRFMLFGYADIGTVGGEEDPLVQQKIYSSVGLGFRINNPDLVLPSTQIRLGVVNSIEGKEFILGFKLGTVDYPELNIPTTMPGSFNFQ